MRIHILTLILAVSLLTACGADSNADERSRAPAFDAAQYALASDPSDAISTTAARERSEDGDVVVVGRVHLIERNGRAMFKLQDEALMYCGQGEEDCGCLTPWDYCCSPREDLVKHMATVQLLDAEGKPLAVDLHKTALKPGVTGTSSRPPVASPLGVQVAVNFRVWCDAQNRFT